MATDAKRFNLVLPRFIRLGLLGAWAEQRDDAAFSYRQGGQERQLMII